MSRNFSFEQLDDVNLIVDAVYEWGPTRSFAHEPLKKLLSVANTGGFRTKKRRKGKVGEYAYVVLYSTMAELDWPDYLDVTTGQFIYYGDNRKPGHELHDKRGNRLLRDCFGLIDTSTNRMKIPPFLIFTKYSNQAHAKFRGLAVPGHPLKSPGEQLMAIWKATGEDRFQNYRASFSILNVDVVERAFIEDLMKGQVLSDNSPDAWRIWLERGEQVVLKAPQTRIHRSKAEQLPESGTIQLEVLKQLWNHFKNDWRAFEFFSARIVELIGFKVVEMDVTRHTQDGGIDAIGRIALGHGVDDIEVDFALEAKRYEPGKSVGVKETSRLISRLKHRQLGMIVTTSFVAPQAYTEIRTDGHPVIIVSGLDISNILIEQGFGKPEDLKSWLQTNFPVSDGRERK